MLDKKKQKLSPELKASIAYIICNIIQKSLSFITMPLFTRLLTIEQYGQFSVFTSWASIFSIILTLNLAYGSFGKAMIKFEDRKREYISSIQTLVLVISFIVIAIYIPFHRIFNGLLAMSTPLVLLLISEIIAEFGFQCWIGMKRYDNKYIGIVIVTLLITFLAPVSALILVLNSENKGIARIVGYVSINIIICGIVFIVNFFKGKKGFSKEYWSYALKFNIILLPYYFSQVIFNQSDRIMIERICGLSEAGIYSVAYSFSLILIFVLNSINNAYTPWLFKRIKSENVSDNKIITIIITIIMCTLVGGIIWIAPEAIRLMAGENYISAIWVVPPVSISLILLLYSGFFNNFLFYFECKFRLVFSSIFAAVVNVLLNLLLLPKFGFIAAGYTTLISYILFCLGNYLLAKKFISKGTKLHNAFNLKLLILIFIIFVALSYVGVLLYSYPIVRYVSIFTVIFVLILLRKKLLKLYNKVKLSLKENNQVVEEKINE